MGGDYTRMTFEPDDDHSAVLMQQGRVQVDADWNEWAELLDRRWRTETVDIIGRGVVPRETPDGFRITPAGGDLRIGRGRIYVDGLLAENHGAAPLEYDPVLGEERGTADVTYGAQKYYPNPPGLPGSGSHLVYLDVWQREVASVQDPTLIDPAVGVETAVRVQTAWQVKLLKGDGGDLTCDRVSGWEDLIRPSAGRLTTGAVGVPASTDPCFISPSGGYRGRENRLYRVEVHRAGPLGTATFKWSRDNASIATPVRDMNGARTELIVDRIGRDAVLRFRVNDWVEVLDDWQELGGLPGELRKVAAVDEARQALVLDSPLTAGTYDLTADPSRHTRVRRWDQSGLVLDANGAIVADVDAAGTLGQIVVPLAGGSLVLEDGVEVTFTTDPAGGSFRVGDYWVFAARTADGSVEALQAAPPRGIKHHYCKLAIVTFPVGVDDCRKFWPPDLDEECCDCTVCVSPESHMSGALTLQQAIETVKQRGGGTVCLDVGFYLLTEPLRIDRAQSLRLKGQGWKSVVVFAGGGFAASITGSIGVTIEALTFLRTTHVREKPAAENIPTVVIGQAAGVTVQRCVIVHADPRTRVTGGETLNAAVAQRVAAPAIGLAGILFQTVIRENVLIAAMGIVSLAGDSARATLARLRLAGTDRIPYLLTFGLRLEDNLALCAVLGVGLRDFSLHLGETRIAGNSIRGTLTAGILTTGLVPPAAGANLDILDNHLDTRGFGIVVGAGSSRVNGNDIGRTAPASPEDRAFLQRLDRSDGIVLAAGLDKQGVDRCQILANRITGLPGRGIHVVAPVRSAMIKQNIIQGMARGGIIMDGAASAGALTLENNQIRDIAASREDLDDGVAAIGLLNVRLADISGNLAVRIGSVAGTTPRRLGIRVAMCQSARIAGNTLVGIGSSSDGGDHVGIEVIMPCERLDVSGNVVRQFEGSAKPVDARWTPLRIRRFRPIIVAELPSLVGAFVGTSKSSKLTTVPGISSAKFATLATGLFGIFPGLVAPLPEVEEAVGVRGNLFESYSQATLVLAFVRGACVFTDNRCLHIAEPDDSLTSVVLQANSTVACNNFIRSPRSARSLAINAGGAPFTVVANLTSGRVVANNTSLTGPWDVLNVLES